jgi:ribosomal-protein-alanine acetyltransferase
MTWMLRRAGEQDLDAIMAIETATFEADAWSPESMRAELLSPHTYYLVAVRVDEPSAVDKSSVVDGYAGLLAPVGAGDADIQTIAVAASARRQGLGRTLMRHLMTEAHQRGAARLFLDVRADNPGAQTLYEALGFEPIAVRPGYYQPDNVDAVVMRHTLVPPAPGLAGEQS